MSIRLKRVIIGFFLIFALIPTLIFANPNSQPQGFGQAMPNQPSNQNPDGIDFSADLNAQANESNPNSATLFDGVGKDTLTYYQIGQASWYGKRFHGKKTASGEIFDMYNYSAAHRTLPFGTRVLVRNMENGKEIAVIINDRGPFVQHRIIDVSYAAAVALDFEKKGMAQVGLIIVESSPRVAEHNQGNNQAARLDMTDNQNRYESFETEPEPAPATPSNNRRVDDDPFANWEEEGRPVQSAPASQREEPHYQGYNQGQATQNYQFENQPQQQRFVPVVANPQQPRPNHPRRGSFSIQIASFRVMDNAQRMKQNLSSQTRQPVFVVQAGQWHKVWLGEFASRSEADAYRRNHQAFLPPKTIIYQNN